MPRKPAHLEMSGGKGLRQRLWDRIRQLNGERFEVFEILIGAEVKSESTAREYICGLTNAGYLERSESATTAGPTSRRKSASYKLVRDVGVEAPRVRRDGSTVTMGLAQEQMWRTLRTLKGDTNARELAAYASTPDIPVEEIAAKSYLKALYAADYLLRTAEGKGRGKGGIQARYRLQKNTGPRPPMVQRTDALYDPNLGDVVWIKPVNEETAIYGQ